MPVMQSSFIALAAALIASATQGRFVGFLLLGLWFAAQITKQKPPPFSAASPGNG
jgi:hypothetical protein